MTRAPLAAALLGALIAAQGVAVAAPKPAQSFNWPAESSRLVDGPGVQHAQTYCLSCHSADYITTQPRGMNQAFWDGEVAKMRKNYGAPMPDDEAKAVAAYLVAAYATAPPPAAVHRKPPRRRRSAA
jgi:hypothetical protein